MSILTLEDTTFDSTPMGDAGQIAKCQFCGGKRRGTYHCVIHPKSQTYWLYPCNYLQELICPRAVKENRRNSKWKKQ